MKAFPDNTEIETIVTFAADQPGALVANVTPDPQSFTMRIHHSFLRAPTGYTPRRADPRIGVSAVSFRDYAKPFNENTEVEWVTRWRLEKQNPGAAMSEPKKPIVFYLDAGIPEPIRSAMREGALWWNKAFEAAGFRNAVQVKDPTPDMDPMDIRYAWILWINRDERGFSSGGTYRDPRTGEILGSKTRMDSHRIRTIGNYFESYTPTTGGGAERRRLRDGAAGARRRAGAGVAGGADDAGGAARAGAAAPVAAHRARARPRDGLWPQLRVEHQRSRVGDGVSDAARESRRAAASISATRSRRSIGAVRRLHDALRLHRVPADKERQGLETPSSPRCARRTSSTCRRPIRAGSGTTTARRRPSTCARRWRRARSCWRSTARPSCKPGEPIGALRDMRLWMTYLHHRWAIEAGLGYVGGMYHNIVVKGETLPPTEIVPAALQREVLGLLMEAIEPANLAIPETLLAQLTPSPGANLEDLSEDYAFDHLRAARILSAMVLEPLLDAGARGAARGVCRSAARRAVAAGGRGRDARADVARGARRRRRGTGRCAA